MKKNSWIIKPRKGLRGIFTVPGDKSISHRSLFFGSLANGMTEITGFLAGEDCLRTLEAFRGLGVEISHDGDRLTIQGKGLFGLKEPVNVLDMGNSGTSTRLFCGLLAGQKFYSVLSGDKYLNNRPMKRVTAPLGKMGARILGREQGNLAPLAIAGQPLKAIVHHSKIASAQVKTSLTLAAIHASGNTVITEPQKSRDHTERMLSCLGYPIKQVNDLEIEVPGHAEMSAAPIDIPGDISSAAFFVVAALITPDSEIAIQNVGLNPTRTGIIEVLRDMGAKIKIENIQEINSEPRATLIVKSSRLKGIEIGGGMIPRLIDEIPILAIAAAVAEGVTIIKDAQELRVKESDRITAVVSQLRKLGVDATETGDGMTIQGRERLMSGKINSFGDHRIAMAFAVAALNADREVEIMDIDCVKTSFPAFYSTLSSL